MSVDRFTRPQRRKTVLPDIPERSCLYPLAPWGVGTSDVESLTSYVARLAVIHQVPTGILLGKYVTPIISQFTSKDVPRISHSFWRAFGTDTGAWNGLGVMAFNCAVALCSLTKQDHLHLLTLLSWNQVLSHRGLLRPYKAWCPACYEEWEKLGIVVHEPLLWSLKLVTVCVRHQQRLQHQCPNCFRSLYWLEWNSRPGFCSRCHQWLGKTECSREMLDKQEEVWQAFVVKNVEELVVAAPTLRQVALEIGYDPGDLSKYFPDLCRAISVRYKRRKLEA